MQVLVYPNPEVDLTIFSPFKTISKKNNIFFHFFFATAKIIYTFIKANQSRPD